MPRIADSLSPEKVAELNELSTHLLEEDEVKVIQIQERMGVSRIANNNEAHKSFLLSKILKHTDDNLKEDLLKKIDSLPNELLERILGLVLNIPTAAKAITTSPIFSANITWFFETFNNDKVRMCFLLNEKATERFVKFSPGLKEEFLEKAENFTNFQSSILTTKIEADGSSGN